MTGEHAFVLHIVAPDLETLRKVMLSRLLKIPRVRDVQSSIVLDSLKRTNRLPLHHLHRNWKVTAGAVIGAPHQVLTPAHAGAPIPGMPARLTLCAPMTNAASANASAS